MDLARVAPAFVEMAHRIVWATVATVDPEGRPLARPVAAAGATGFGAADRGGRRAAHVVGLTETSVPSRYAGSQSAVREFDGHGSWGQKKGTGVLAPGTTPHTKRKTTRLPRRAAAVPPQRLSRPTRRLAPVGRTAEPASPEGSPGRNDRRQTRHRRATLHSVARRSELVPSYRTL